MIHLQTEYLGVTKTSLPPFYAVPLFLWDKMPKALSAEARLLYGLLFSRAALSQANGWHENGKTFIYYTMKQVAERLGCGERKAARLMRELETNCLIERTRRTCGDTYRIFLKIMPIGARPTGADRGACQIESGSVVKNGSDRSPNDSATPVKNAVYIDRTEVDRKNQIPLLRESDADEARAFFGSNRNVRLSDDEVAALEKAHPRIWREYVEQLSSYMASTGKKYASHYVTICRWIQRSLQRPTMKEYHCEEGESL